MCIRDRDFYIGAPRKHAIRISFIMSAQKEVNKCRGKCGVSTRVNAPLPTSGTSSVLGWGAFALMAEQAGSREVNEKRGPQAVCVRRKKNRLKNPARPRTHHEIHSSPATATNSRWLATKHVPRVSPYSPASIGPGFAEIGLVQLSQSVKTTNVAHTHRRTDSLIK